MPSFQASSPSLFQTTSLENRKRASVIDQGAARINKDHLLIGSHTFGVFDGSSSLPRGFCRIPPMGPVQHDYRPAPRPQS